jgi:predicted TIM-barrel fold metal-dependent hydrolase
VTFIDCDSHVIECEETWRSLGPDWGVYRPAIAEFTSNRQPRRCAEGVPLRRMWVVGDQWLNAPRGDGNSRNNANVFSPDATQLRDPSKRLEDMDALGIECQLLISSFFIGCEIEHPLAEAAICESYNRWMAEKVGSYASRLPWTARVPMMSLERGIEQAEFAKRHGAVGIHVRGIEHGMYLSDPYFFPLYEAVESLGLAVFVHVGAAHSAIRNQPIGELMPAPASYMYHLHALMAGFHAVVASDLDSRFPRLRWGFLEGGATWVPAVLQQHVRFAASGDRFLELQQFEPEALARKNIFVACEADEDLSYLVKVLGENVLVTGTDYGHNDIGSELGVHQVIIDGGALDAAAAEKIVCDNGRRLLGRTGTSAEEANTFAAGTKYSPPPHVHAARDHGSAILTGRP